MTLLGSVLQHLRDMLVGIIAYLPQLVAGLLVGLLALLVAGRVRRWGEALAARLKAPEQVERLIINLAYVLALVVGLIVALSVIGVNVYSMVAGLGITGLVVGFALKDILENMIAGVLLLLRRPFDLGDFIEVEKFAGTVTNIAIRDTTLRTPDNVEAILPNRLVYTSPILNASAYALRRREVTLVLAYSPDLARTLRVILDAVTHAEGVAGGNPPSIWLGSLDESRVMGTLYFWVDTPTHDLLETHSAVVEAIQAAVLREKIEMPYSFQVVQLQQPAPPGGR
jgi:small-conductance mechanosensitive channel